MTRMLHQVAATRQRKPPAALRVFAGLLTILSLLPSSAVLAEDFSFGALNRNYTNLVSVLDPIEVGPATVVVRSPEHVLHLVSHSAQLAPAAAGGIDALLTVEIQGSGQIDADISMTGLNTTVHDALVVPRQTIEVRGRLSVATDEQAYVIRALELQPTIQIRIQSELATRLFKICRPMGLVLVALDCRELERSLTDLEVPLPTDRAFYLEFAELSADERARLDRFLDTAE